MTNGQNEVLQQINRVLVLSILRNKRSPRAEIAKMTGLQRATITNIINDFTPTCANRHYGRRKAGAAS